MIVKSLVGYYFLGRVDLKKTSGTPRQLLRRVIFFRSDKKHSRGQDNIDDAEKTPARVHFFYCEGEIPVHVLLLMTRSIYPTNGYLFIDHQPRARVSRSHLDDDAQRILLLNHLRVPDAWFIVLILAKLCR